MIANVFLRNKPEIMRLIDAYLWIGIRITQIFMDHFRMEQCKSMIRLWIISWVLMLMIIRIRNRLLGKLRFFRMRLLPLGVRMDGLNYMRQYMGLK